MASVKDLLDILNEFKNTPESRGIDLRLDFADIILKQLDEKGWTQKQLAEKIGKKESFISRIIHAESNCTFETVGCILFALDIKVELQEKFTVTDDYSVIAANPPTYLHIQDIPHARKAQATVFNQIGT